MSSASSAFDPELVDQTRQQLRSLVHEIEGLSRSDLSPGEFYEGFLNRVVAALAGIGGAVWTIDESGRFKLVYQMNLQQTRLAESEVAQQQHGLLLRKVANTGQGDLFAPHSGAGSDADGNSVNGSETNGSESNGSESNGSLTEGGVAPSNPTEFLLVLGALKSDKEVQGVVEIFQRPGGRTTVERGYLRFLTQMCDLAGDYLKTRNLRLFADRQLMWTQLELFTRLVHEGLDPKQTAFTIANEGRRLIGCDRVTVALRYGKQMPRRRGERARNHRQAIEHGFAIGQVGDRRRRGGRSALVHRRHARIFRRRSRRRSRVMPTKRIRSSSPCCRWPDRGPNQKRTNWTARRPISSALIVEQISEDTLTESMRRRVDVVAEHSALALTNAREHNDLFLMPVWRGIGKMGWVVRARTLPKTLAITVAVLVVLIALFVIPYPFELSGSGTLEPVAKRDIFAGVDGVVEKVAVQEGHHVKKGDTLLALRNLDLDAALSKVAGDLSVANEQQATAERSLHDTHLTREERERLQGQVQQYAQTASSADEQLQLL